MPTLLGPARALLGACLTLAFVTGCAVNHSDDFVSLVTTKEIGPAPIPVANVEVVVVAGMFGDVTTKGKSAPGDDRQSPARHPAAGVARAVAGRPAAQRDPGAAG